jgi:hypothetical protein
MAVLVAVATSSGVGAGTISATGSLAATSFVSRSGSGPISATASIEGAGLDDPTPAGAGSVSATGTMAATGRPVYQGSGPIDAAGTLTATGDALANTGSGSVSAVGAMTGGPIAATGALAAAGGSSPRQGSGSVSAAGTLAGNGLSPGAPAGPRRILFHVDRQFTNSGPSPAPEATIADRLSRYVDDCNTIFAKSTDMVWSYSPSTDCIFHDQMPTNFDDPLITTPPWGLAPDNWQVEFWVHWVPTSTTGAAGGRVSHAGFGGLGLSWMAVFSNEETDDNVTLAPGGFVTLSEHYSYGLDLLIHEFLHNMGVGIGEYYTLINIRDFSGIEPDVSGIKEGLYWDDRGLVLADVMSQRHDDGRELFLEDVQLCPLTSFIVNEVLDGNRLENSIAYSQYDHPLGVEVDVVVEVRRSSNGSPIEGATVSAWRNPQDIYTHVVLQGDPYETAVTDSSGRASIEWGAVSLAGFPNIFAGNNSFRTFKVSAPGFQNAAGCLGAWDMNAGVIMPAGGGIFGDFRYPGFLLIELDAA